MPEKETLKRAEQDRKEGKSASTQAGEFVREEIAIGLSKARRAGVDLAPPKKHAKSK